jgi:FtsP/CotA-like multicopper oxidase with cupredoxin domain
MSKINNNRRQFLQYSALGAATAAFPSLGLATTNHLKSTPTRGFNPDIEIEMVARNDNVQILKGGSKTNVQKYSAKLLKGPEATLQHLKNNYLGPILNYQKGQKVRIYFYNKLSEPSIIHWHGLHVPQKSDGHPMYTVQPGEQFVYEFEVLNRAGTSFYHSHAHELTAEQVYQGLAGLITVTDDEEKKLDLPSGEYDLPLVIQDRNFNSRNQLQYLHRMHDRMAGFLGETILVNGKPDVTFSVKSRAYRFRALNGSNSRIYKLGWEDGTPITAIATDAGLLEKPETRPYIMLASGERVDLWLDFSGRPVGSKLVMYSLPYSGVMPPMYARMQQGNNNRGSGMGGMVRMGGMMGGGLAQGAKFPIATFKVTEKVSDSPKLPKKLVAFERLTEANTDNANKPLPIAISMGPMSPRLNGKSFSVDRVFDFEKVPVGSIKKIKIFHANTMGGGMGGGMMMSMAHPIHLHGQQYQIISRKMPSTRIDEYATVKEGFIDSGWKDTVLVMPGEEIEIIKPFQDFKGLFLYHCHNLEHEDLGMMRQFYVN